MSERRRCPECGSEMEGIYGLGTAEYSDGFQQTVLVLVWFLCSKCGHREPAGGKEK